MVSPKVIYFCINTRFMSLLYIYKRFCQLPRFCSALWWMLVARGPSAHPWQ